MSPSLLSAITLLLSATAALSDTFSFQPLNSTCSHNGTPPASNRTSFLSNLNSLLSNLTALSISSLSANLSFGDPPNRAFGLYFCTGDLPQADCRNCILTAAADLPSLCGSNRTGAVWYDYCQLRYSDTQFFGAPDTEGFSRINPFANLSDPSEAIGIVSRLVEEAPISRPLMFAYYASVDDNLYGLAQCSGDLNATGCTTCLSIIIDRILRCCERARGWRYMALSCWVRFEASPFLKNIMVPTQIIEYNCVSSTFPNNSIALMNTTLNDLLSSLKSQGSTSGFYNTTITSGAIQIHGRVLCRMDINSTSCSSCLGNSSRYILRNCPKSDGGIVWYERCQLSYWVEGFYGAVEGFERVFCNEQESTEEADRTVDAMMLRLIGEAAEKAVMFAVGNVSISDSLARYGLVQCSRDLGREECRGCLMRGKVNASLTCKQKKGWRYLSASCNLRYEDFPFYGAQVTPDRIEPNAPEKSKPPKVLIVSVVAAVIGAMLLGSLLSILYRMKLRGRTEKIMAYVQSEPLSQDLPSIDMVTLQEATSNFSNANKLGKGGFGPVYKGILADGKEVAVKRLAAASSQGTEEFKTEVRLIAKLQHRNLVRLVGCCIDGEEKLLIYEYLSNGSLDTFLFDDEKRTQLDWTARDRIILGIARGMVYLHEDSQLRVIHRDLKAGNILLDVDLNPKISDFGMARIFKNDQDEARTRKIVGTLGYMSPEYAMDGRFSVKSDVFSFGVLLLEIITGQKNGRSFFTGNGRTLLDYVWQLWREGRGMDTVDPMLTASCPSEEATRGIHVGLLCVQEAADDRPEMSMVLQMLVSRGMVLPDPKHPPTYVRRAVVAASEGSSSHEKNARGHSVNDMTLTAMEGR